MWRQPQQDVERWIPSVFTPLKTHQDFALNPRLEDEGPCLWRDRRENCLLVAPLRCAWRGWEGVWQAGDSFSVSTARGH